MKSSLTESFIEHQALDRFVINTTALHNAHLLRRCLPRSVWAPVPFFDTPAQRLAKHHELAAELRTTQVGKRAKRKTAAAAAATARGTKRKATKQKTGVKKKLRAMKGGLDMDEDVDLDFQLVNDSDSDSDGDHDGGSKGEGTSKPRDSDDSEEEEIYVPRATRRPRGQAIVINL